MDKQNTSALDKDLKSIETLRNFNVRSHLDKSIESETRISSLAWKKSRAQAKNKYRTQSTIPP